MGTTSTADDTEQQNVLNRALSIVEGYLGYPLRRTVYSETVAGYGSNELQLSRLPVLAVESVYYSTDLIESTSYAIDRPMAGILSRDLGWTWTAGLQYELAGHVAPNSELKPFTAVYEAGYCMNGSTASGWLTTGEPVPYEIEAALLATANSIYKGRNRDGAVSSKRIGDLSITYETGQASGIPSAAANMIQHLRRF
jgi:hypothetical protein